MIFDDNTAVELSSAARQWATASLYVLVIVTETSKLCVTSDFTNKVTSFFMMIIVKFAGKYESTVQVKETVAPSDMKSSEGGFGAKLISAALSINM